MHVNYGAGMMIYLDFFQFLDILMPTGGQIHKSILLKCRTLIHFRICYKIHCVCKLWTGTMILWFLPISRHFAAPWWPNTEINMTEMLYPDRFHDLPSFQFIVYVNYEQKTMKPGKLANSVIFHKQRWPPVGHLEPDQPNFLCADRFDDLPQVFNSLCM